MPQGCRRDRRDPHGLQGHRCRDAGPAGTGGDSPYLAPGGVREGMTMEKLELDGSQGEGGGQILRTALTLSMITGAPFRLERIRAKRPKPGLLRQHLTAVKAAAEICQAKVS